MYRQGDIMSEQRYVEIPGSKTHELPPLLLHCATDCAADLTSVMPEAEDMLASSDAGEEILEQRKLDLALQLTEQYKGLLSHWLWGDSVIEWIRQCEITFESEGVLRKLLHPDVWPHASRASFVELLREKEVPTGGVALDRAVGLRLTFRQPPPIDCFLEPVPVLFERDGGRHGVPRLVAVSGAVSAGPLPLRRAGCELRQADLLLYVPRRPRVIIPGVAHHITQRGNNRQPVFLSNESRQFYLDLLVRNAARHGARILGYCLMDNHVHLAAIPDREDSLARTLGPTHSEYALFLNRAGDRSGHLWQNRFFSCPMDESHLVTSPALHRTQPCACGDGRLRLGLAMVQRARPRVRRRQ
jgi:REP element-mobilizing transposase RayT